jgi:hypothetical protein
MLDKAYEDEKAEPSNDEVRLFSHLSLAIDARIPNGVTHAAHVSTTASAVRHRIERSKRGARRSVKNLQIAYMLELLRSNSLHNPARKSLLAGLGVVGATGARTFMVKPV